MGRLFESPQHVTSWRRLAPHVWDRPADPTVYGVMDLVVDRALPYLDDLGRASGTKVRVTHLVAKGLALGLQRMPQANGIVTRRRIALRKTVDIFV